jgi:hypothetical protein
MADASEYPAYTPAQLLVRLNTARQQAKQLPLPLLNIALRSGQVFTGALQNLQFDKQTEQPLSIVLELATGDLVFLLAAEVVAVSLKATPQQLPILAEGPLKLHAPEPPSQLELRRHLAAMAEAFTHWLGYTVSVEFATPVAQTVPAELVALEHGIRAMGEVLARWKTDDLALKALQGHVKAVRVAVAHPNRALRDGDTLRIECSASGPLWSAIALQSELERGL